MTPWRVIGVFGAGVLSTAMGGIAAMLLRVELRGDNVMGLWDILVPGLVIIVPGIIVTMTAVEGAWAFHYRSLAQKNLRAAKAAKNDPA